MPANTAIILLNWNKSDLTIDCVKSIIEGDHTGFEIFVLDNGSRPEPYEELKVLPQNVHLLRVEQNLGFTGGNNYAAWVVRDNYPHIKYLIFLNNDTLVASDALQILVDEIEKDSQIGIVTPLIMLYPNKHLIWAAGTSIKENIGAAGLTDYGKEIGPENTQERLLEWSTGCCLVIRAELFNKLNGFCDDYFVSGEDIDLSFQVKNLGYKIKYIPRSVIFHKHAEGAGGFNNHIYVYYQIRNELMFRQRWVKGFLRRIVSYSVFMLYILKRGIPLLFQGNKTYFKSVFLAFNDFLKGVSGKRTSF